LRDSVATPNLEVLLAKIGKDNPDFAPIVGINGAGTVQYSDAVI
jgi:hypothetical protein